MTKHALLKRVLQLLLMAAVLLILVACPRRQPEQPATTPPPATTPAEPAAPPAGEEPEEPAEEVAETEEEPTEPQEPEGAETAGLEITVEPQDAIVTVVGPNEYNQEFSGGQTLTDLTAGTYIITATSEGYRAAVEEVEVAEGDTATIQLTLEEGEAEPAEPEETTPEEEAEEEEGG